MQKEEFIQLLRNTTTKSTVFIEDIPLGTIFEGYLDRAGVKDQFLRTHEGAASLSSGGARSFHANVDVQEYREIVSA